GSSRERTGPQPRPLPWRPPAPDRAPSACPAEHALRRRRDRALRRPRASRRYRAHIARGSSCLGLHDGRPSYLLARRQGLEPFDDLHLAELVGVDDDLVLVEIAV